jgi:hypothetical protein
MSATKVILGMPSSKRSTTMINAVEVMLTNRNGWPESIQKEGDYKKHTYREADDEWGRRMAATRSRK